MSKIYRTDYFGFVYLWRDRLSGRFYLGSHFGSHQDKYICSNKWMLSAYKKRPHDFTRRIIQWVVIDDIKALQRTEQRWLDMIPDCQLSTSENVVAGTNRYYNMKKLASGGSHKGHQKTRTKPQWNTGLTKEMMEARKAGVFSLLIDRPSKQTSRTIKIKKNKEPKLLKNFCNVLLKNCSNCSSEFYVRDYYEYRDRKYCSKTCQHNANSKPLPEEVKEKLRGKPAWNKGLPNPHAAENGRKSAMKQSITVAGRSRKYNEDGSWSWQHHK